MEAHYDALAVAVVNNLRDQHGWGSLERIPPNITRKKSETLCLRPFIRGLPPRLLYLHPDDQKTAIIEHGQVGPPEQPCPEWVFPMHVTESCSVRGFASMFDVIALSPILSESSSQPGQPRRQPSNKRILLAVVHTDSTIVYYFLHGGIVKPRQN
jgi:tRNA-splicing endonuclease subunit Sen15